MKVELGWVILLGIICVLVIMGTAAANPKGFKYNKEFSEHWRHESVFDVEGTRVYCAWFNKGISCVALNGSSNRTAR